KGLELVLAIEGGVPATVLGDPVRVRQILTNFITNALKFTERGRVRVHAAATEPGHVRLSVSDTGPGVDPKTQARLFMPFSQAVDGRMALDAVDLSERQGQLFDAVLLDVQMPQMSGHEVARELRRRWDGQVLPIIALTAAALVSEREQALASGMNEFLTKPIDAQKLKETLARLIAARPRVG